MITNVELILASSSKIRKKILEESRLDFKVISPFFDEEKGKKSLKHLSIKQLAMSLASLKALSVSEKFPNAYVIGSDQICEFEEKAISKSNNFDQAVSQLKKFNGKIHYQNNATVIAHKNKIIFKNFCRAKMQMRKITQKEIETYVKNEQSWGCAGSYQYESLGKHLFSKVDGDYYSILGLSIQPVLSFLHEKKLIKFKI